MHWLESLAAMTRSHLGGIAISLTAMILIILGPALNKGMKTVAGPLHWTLRYALFVLFATVGGGLLTHFSVASIHHALKRLPDGQLVGTVAGAHLLIAWFLKRENHI